MSSIYFYLKSRSDKGILVNFQEKRDNREKKLFWYFLYFNKNIAKFEWNKETDIGQTDHSLSIPN